MHCPYLCNSNREEQQLRRAKNFLDGGTDKDIYENYILNNF